MRSVDWERVVAQLNLVDRDPLSACLDRRIQQTWHLVSAPTQQICSHLVSENPIDAIKSIIRRTSNIFWFAPGEVQRRTPIPCVESLSLFCLWKWGHANTIDIGIGFSNADDFFKKKIPKKSSCDVKYSSNLPTIKIRMHFVRVLRVLSLEIWHS